MIGLSAILVAAALQAGTPPLRVLDAGDQSAIQTARQVVLRTSAEWRAFWTLHAPGRTLPAVDFDREMAVAVFVGERPTAGYAVEIVSVQGRDGAVVVRYRERPPSPDSMTAQIITYPFQIVVVPKAVGRERFEKLPP